jgi:hypothetical protein
MAVEDDRQAADDDVAAAAGVQVPNRNSRGIMAGIYPTSGAVWVRQG